MTPFPALNTHSTRYLTCAVVSALLLTAPQAIAVEAGASSGTLTFEKSEHLDSTHNGTKVVTRTVTGVSHAKEKGGPLDDARFRCHMTLVVAVKSKAPAEGSGYCHGVGSNGDSWAMLLSGGDTGGTWMFVDGTGRYDNIKGSGTWRHGGSPQNKSERYDWVGHWELEH